MAILVDYRCGACGDRAEHWSPSPPASSVACRSCGGEARRLFSAIGLSGGAPAPTDPAAVPSRRGPKLCAQYPQVPGLCHMSESAGRMWVAKALKDGRAIDREQERQEAQATHTTPTMADAITHHHHAPVAPTPSSS